MANLLMLGIPGHRPFADQTAMTVELLPAGPRAKCLAGIADWNFKLGPAFQIAAINPALVIALGVRYLIHACLPCPKAQIENGRDPVEEGRPFLDSAAMRTLRGRPRRRGSASGFCRRGLGKDAFTSGRVSGSRLIEATLTMDLVGPIFLASNRPSAIHL